jgi:hypothetical protein
MNITDEKGYLIVASNNSTVDYIQCARVLAKSIKLFMPGAKVCLLTDDASIEHDIFDYVNVFPYGDVSDTEWKLNNDWQVFDASPFRETIKIEADMIVTSDIGHWWTMLRHRDVVITMGCRNFKNEISYNRYYRKIFDINCLPDVYNAITYWRLSKVAKEFFGLVRNIFENWDGYKLLLIGGTNEAATTDVVYAMAAVILGVEKVTLPKTTYPSLIHMKSRINNITDADWTNQLVWEISNHDFRINTVSQQYPVHYHNKDFAKTIEPIYDKLLGSS